MNKLQKKVKKFTQENDIETKVEFRVLDLISEVGELSKEFLKATEYGKEDFVTTQNWESELGDVLFSVLCLSNSTEIDIGKCLEATLERYENRIKKAGSPGSEQKMKD